MKLLFAVAIAPFVMAAGYSDHAILPPPGLSVSEEAPPPSKPPCDTLEACLKAIETTARGQAGISPEEDRLADTLNAYGDRAVPRLMPLLKHRNPAMRQLAGYILSSQPGLRPEHVPALIAAVKHGDGWLPNAIAHIGTPEAIAFLIGELIRLKEHQNQVGSAFDFLGEKGVPALVQLFRCQTSCDERLLNAVASLLGELGERGASAVPRLEAIASNEKIKREGRLGAVDALGALGPYATNAVPALQRLIAADPSHFRDRAQSALARIGGAEGVAVLLDRLRATPDLSSFRDIAELGSRGQSAGPALIEYLHHPDPDVVLGAARTLGFVHCEGAVGPLVDLLVRQEDWRLTYAVAESLGRLHAKEAASVLESVAAKHWYPPVVAAAQKAISVIEGRAEYESRYHPRNFAFEFFSYQWAASESHIDGCPEGLTGRRGSSPSVDMTYDAGLVEYEDHGHMTHRIKQRAETALKVDDGWLLGASRGEWGGELVHVDAKGVQYTVVHDNTVGVFRLGNAVVAIGGLSHLGLNHGWAYRVTRDADGHFIATRWRALPGGPESASLQPDGSVLVHSHGGSVLIAPDGEMELAACQPSEPGSD